MSEPEITAHLREAVFDVSALGRVVVSGAIHNDAQKRFEDGFRVTTSPVIGFDNDRRIVITRSGSAYTVSPWSALTRCACCNEVTLFTGYADEKWSRALRVARGSRPDETVRDGGTNG